MNKNKLKISKSDILSMHYFGKTNGEIAEIAGVSPGRISQIVNGYYKCDQNITMTAKKPEPKPEKRPRGASKSKSKEKKPVTIMTPILVEMHRQGKSMASIARDTGFDYAEVRKRINAEESKTNKVMAERQRLLEMEQELVRYDERIKQIKVATRQIEREMRRGVKDGYISEKELKDMFSHVTYM